MTSSVSAITRRKERSSISIHKRMTPSPESIATGSATHSRASARFAYSNSANTLPLPMNSCGFSPVNSTLMTSLDASSAGGLPVTPRRWFKPSFSMRSSISLICSAGAERISSSQVTLAPRTTISSWANSHLINCERSPSWRRCNASPANQRVPSESLRISTWDPVKPMSLNTMVPLTSVFQDNTVSTRSSARVCWPPPSCTRTSKKVSAGR